MAARKSTAQKAAEAPKEEPKVEEAKDAPEEPQEAPKAEDKPKDAGKMVLVRNKARFDYVQPSTGIKIYVNSSKPTKVLEDGWVEAFVDAGLLEYA